MIDLHIHTKHSDGSESAVSILEKAQDLGLEIISITDHDSVDAYDELGQVDCSEIFSGKIITGVEFTTTFDGYTTEILGYGCDYKIIQKVLKEFYNSRFLRWQQKDILRQMKKIIKDHDLTFDFNDKKNCESFMSYYLELKRHKENIDKVQNGLLDKFKYFLRKGYANPNSDFFVDKSKYYLDFNDIIDIIHKAGGKAFLAHAYVYQFDDTLAMLNKIFSQSKLDGLECYYSAFSDEQISTLIEFADSHNLLKSGGTDFHGELRPECKLGVGLGNLCVPKKIVEDWEVVQS